VNGVSQVWDFGDGTFSLLQDPPPHTYSSVGDYTIVLTVTNSDGCASTTSQVVHVYASPQVIIGAQNVCVGTAAQFTDLTVTAAGNPVVQWAWDFGDGSTDTLQSPTHLYAAAGIYTVSLLATTPYCSNSGVLQVTVEALPVAGFVPSDAYGCSPFNVSFANTSAGAVTQQWSFGDGATSNAFSPAHTYMNTGPSDTTFTVVLVVSTAFGCTDTTVSTITVASFTHNGIPGCAPLAVDFTNLSTGASAYAWSFGDGATSTAFQPSHTYVNNTLLQQVDTVTLVVTSPGGCSDTTTQTVVVYPTADLNFISLPDSGCSPLEVTFSPVVGAVTFQWDLGDGSTSTSVQPVHTYVNAGLSTVVYPVTLVAGNAFGCQDTAFATVLVYPSPLAQFTPSAMAGCQPLPITFTDQSIGAVNLEWHFGDGSTQSGGVGATTHTYANPGAVPLTLDVLQIATSAFGCSDTAVVPIQVFPLLQAAFSAPPEGCSPLTLQLNDVGAGGSSWQWDMGDGTVLVGNGVTHTYVNNSTADITRTITLVVTSPYGCTDTLQQSVVVHPVTNAAFFATPLIQQFPNATVTVVNNTPNGAWSYAWDFGDGSVSALEDPPPHTYGTWGQYTITLVVISGTCTDTLTQPVEVTPPMPTASFIGAGEGCQPLTVSFTNTSLLGLSYLWNFGDGGTSTADSPTYTWNQPGTYAVSVTAFGPGGTVSTAVKIDSVIVHPRAVAYFVLQPDEVVVPSQPVFTYNLSANATDYLWDFGDGVTSTELRTTNGIVRTPSWCRVL
jgi:PKD repeat protein